MTDAPCMGGWCKSRAGCLNYHQTGPEPAERLCPKGQDFPEPIKAAVECPYCHEKHTLSQCQKWKLRTTNTAETA